MNHRRPVFESMLWLGWTFLVVDGACGADDSTRPTATKLVQSNP